MLGALALLTPLAALALPRHADVPRRGVLTGLGIAASALTVALALPGLQRAGRVSGTQLLETSLPAAVAQAALPAGAVVIAEWPTVLATDTDVHAVPAGAFVSPDDPGFARLAAAMQQRPHFLLRDMFCDSDFTGDANVPACARILAHFACAEVTAVSDTHRRYGLCQLSLRTPHTTVLDSEED